MQEHVDDPFVHLANKEGWRSRAIYKLKEIDEKDKLLKQGQVVVDLGAAPGSWSQYVSQQLGETGEVFALDILPFEPYAGVTFVQGDFREDEVYQELLDKLGGRQVDLVLSDMAPNMSGNKATDDARAAYLVELAIDFADTTLKPQGNILIKVFQGQGFNEIMQSLRDKYTKVISRKPLASRARSSEIYLLGLGKK